jgi:hypothetical protein
MYIQKKKLFIYNVFLEIYYKNFEVYICIYYFHCVCCVIVIATTERHNLPEHQANSTPLHTIVFKLLCSPRIWSIICRNFVSVFGTKFPICKCFTFLTSSPSNISIFCWFFLIKPHWMRNFLFFFTSHTSISELISSTKITKITTRNCIIIFNDFTILLTIMTFIFWNKSSWILSINLSTLISTYFNGI